MQTIPRRCTMLLVQLAIVLSVAGCADARRVRPPARASAAALRLHVLDCGSIGPIDPAQFGLKADEIGGDVSLVTPCYVVVHPEGTLLWDTGQVLDANIPDDGTQVVEQGILKATRRLSSQLAELGYSPADIDYLAMSHHHIDHSANANAFASSKWIVQRAEYEAMFADEQMATPLATSYRGLKNATRVVVENADHDVFGDGSVIVKAAPGHTPGHQILFLKLRNFGSVLLMGDLYHLPEQKMLDRVSSFEFDAALTRATRRRVDAFIAQTGASAWIQHDPETYAQLKKFPAYYD